MAVMIRLSRIGKKKTPFFRIVAISKKNARDGAYLENLGTYNALTSEIVQFHKEQLQSWIDKGATPSETVKKITQLYNKKNQNPAQAVTPVQASKKPAKKAAAKNADSK